MYSRQEASQLRKNFWTSFGQYMRPLPNADGERVNWLNYKAAVPANGLNPAHGQPGHRCDIAVGQPLSSAPVKN